ncbi:hypothetical protein JZ751_028299, partial [Albula glossodonta]
MRFFLHSLCCLQGTFVVVFSLTSNEVVYVSEQASSILGCKRSFLSSARFVELLYHQDVNIFYSHTAQSRLPPWTVGPDRGQSIPPSPELNLCQDRVEGLAQAPETEITESSASARAHSHPCAPTVGGCRRDKALV